VEAVGDLDGAWCPGARAVSKGATAVAADDTGARVRPQPGGEPLSGRVTQQVNRAVALEVEQNRAEPPLSRAAAERPLIDAQDPRCAAARINGWRHVCCAHEAQKRRPTCGRSKCWKESLAGPTAEREAHIP